MRRTRIDPAAFFYITGHFQDILCEQANDSDVLKQF